MYALSRHLLYPTNFSRIEHPQTPTVGGRQPELQPQSYLFSKSFTNPCTIRTSVRPSLDPETHLSRQKPFLQHPATAYIRHCDNSHHSPRDPFIIWTQYHHRRRRSDLLKAPTPALVENFSLDYRNCPQGDPGFLPQAAPKTSAQLSPSRGQ